MSEFKGTPGPWLREGTLIYALQHYGWRKGEETFCNRFSAGFQLGKECGEEELIANATLAQAAPELLEALQAITDQLECIGDTRPHKDGQFIEAARAAISKALGGQP